MYNIDTQYILTLLGNTIILVIGGSYERNYKQYT